jgi:hypothetical protein
MLLALLLVTTASAEIYMWNEVTLDTENNITNLHGLYTLKDVDSFWGNYEYDFELHYSTQDLPFNLTGGQVDYCNLTYAHYSNDYDSEGNFLNTTITETTLNFDSGLSSGVIDIEMKRNDNLITDMRCHYTDGDYLYQDNILVGRYSVYVPSTQCNRCTEFTLEELSNELERSQEVTERELQIYEIVGTIIELNYRLWVIVSWIVKIFLLVITFVLVFSGIYHLYKFMEDLARRI